MLSSALCVCASNYTSSFVFPCRSVNLTVYVSHLFCLPVSCTLLFFPFHTLLLPFGFRPVRFILFSIFSFLVCVWWRGSLYFRVINSSFDFGRFFFILSFFFGQLSTFFAWINVYRINFCLVVIPWFVPFHNSLSVFV